MLIFSFSLVPSPSASTLRRSPSFSGAIVPPPFRRFVQQTIYQVSASSASLMLSLWFIQRLPVGKTNGEVQTEMKRSFRDDLLASKNEIPWRLLVLGLTLSNKWLEDNTFTTKTWCVVIRSQLHFFLVIHVSLFFF
jgi:hypothetical protein